MKFCSYFPYTAKLCINGHEYLKRQLDRRGIVYEALDNGILSGAEPKTAQAICHGLSADKIEALARKWLRLLPHPFSRRDRRAGYRYEVSILQAEFALTQTLDRSLSGRSTGQLRPQRPPVHGRRTETPSGTNPRPPAGRRVTRTPDLRAQMLRHRGLVERLPKTHRYQVTHFGLRTAVFYSRLHDHLIQPGLSMLMPLDAPPPARLSALLSALDQVLAAQARRLAA